jgi:hypothetical protein
MINIKEEVDFLTPLPEEDMAHKEVEVEEKEKSSFKDEVNIFLDFFL